MAKTILIADDNPAIRKSLCKLFEAEEGYEICAEASNGLEAINLAQTRHPDLIILDLSMPVMDGRSAAEKLKNLMPDVPIILFTQYGDLGKELLGIDSTFDRIVPKSEPKELLRHVKSLIPV
jgi:CheY-like chemotaxis protein